jgi:hypothetical protein
VLNEDGQWIGNSGLGAGCDRGRESKNSDSDEKEVFDEDGAWIGNSGLGGWCSHGRESSVSGGYLR